MKRVLITGANSYVGTNVEKWLMKEPDKYYVETLDMKDPNWKDFDFSKFDVVFHVAGIAHRKVKKRNKEIYYLINRDLAINTASKAKNQGVNHFIFMSSMSVYGKSEGVITKNTIETPISDYGISKLQAEVELKKLNSESFTVSIIRPPMIYGYKAPGNFNSLIKFSKYLFLVPSIRNKRSMIFVDNFAITIKYIIDKKNIDYALVQDKEYVNTIDLIFKIRKVLGKKTFKSTVLGYLLLIFKRIRFVKKVFGSLYYDVNSTLEIPYELISYKDAISYSVK